MKLQALLVGLLLASSANANDPSFIVIVADDVGFPDVRYMNPAADTVTPRLNTLATQGVQFHRAYSTPYCSPTRAAILTGEYPWRNGLGETVKKNGDQGLALGTPTIATALQLAGWKTVALGKWHITKRDDYDLQPYQSLGFDEFRGFYLNLNPVHQAHDRWLKTEEHLQSPYLTLDYATSDCVDEAIDRLTNETDPLFLWVSLANAHSPFHQPPSHLSDLAQGTGDPDYFRTMVQAMDTDMGRLLDALDASSYANNTYVIFISDNGTPPTAVRDVNHVGKAKGTAYEGGIRVPMIIKGPGITPAVSNDLVSCTDLFNTIADLAGVSATAADSTSLKPILDGLPGSRPWVYTERYATVPVDPNDFDPDPHPSWRRAVVGDRYKLQQWRTNGGDVSHLFFDLQADPYENVDLFPESELDTFPVDAAEALAVFQQVLADQGGGIYD